MNRILFTLLFTFLFTGSANAMYRCGTTFSDTPCGIGAVVINLPPPNVVSMPAAQSYEPEVKGPSFITINTPRSESSYCKGLMSKKANAEAWANRFQHPDNVRRARSEAIGYDSQFFRDCYGQ